MIIEHLFYGSSIALLAAMLYRHITKKEGLQYAGLIAFSAVSPDAFSILLRLHYGAIPGGLFLRILEHFSHSIGVLFLYAFLVGLVLFSFRWNYLFSLVFAGIGYSIHLFSDALVYTTGRIYLWPFSPVKMTLGLLGPYEMDLFGIANAEVLCVGIFFLLGSLILYRRYSLARDVSYFPTQ